MVAFSLIVDLFEMTNRQRMNIDSVDTIKHSTKNNQVLFIFDTPA